MIKSFTLFKARKREEPSGNSLSLQKRALMKKRTKKKREKKETLEEKIYTKRNNPHSPRFEPRTPARKASSILTAPRQHILGSFEYQE